MFIAIDLIILVIMAAVIIKAAKRGFISSLFGLLTAAAALVVAIMFYKELGIYINENYVFNAIEPRIVEFVKTTLIEKGGDLGAEAIRNSLPSDVVSLMDTFGIEIGNIFDGLGTVPEDIAATIATELSLALSNAIAYAVLFLVAFVSLSLVCWLLNLIAKIPVLNKINKFFGIVFGIGEALVLGVIIAKLAVAICGVHGSLTGDTALSGVIDQTVVAKFLLSICPW